MEPSHKQPEAPLPVAVLSRKTRSVKRFVKQLEAILPVAKLKAKRSGTSHFA